LSQPQNSGTPTPPGGECTRRYFRLPLAQISYVKFVVEAYEGLAQVSSRPGRGEMEWVVPPGLEQQAEALARALEAEAGLVPIAPPDDWKIF
jgi:hypothetical protein